MKNTNNPEQLRLKDILDRNFWTGGQTAVDRVAKTGPGERLATLALEKPENRPATSTKQL